MSAEPLNLPAILAEHGHHVWHGGLCWTRYPGAEPRCLPYRLAELASHLSEHWTGTTDGCRLCAEGLERLVDAVLTLGEPVVFEDDPEARP